MDAQQKIADVAKKFCLRNGHLWDTTIDPNKPGGLTDDEKKNLTIEQAQVDKNRMEYTEEVTSLYNDLAAIGYTLTTN